MEKIVCIISIVKPSFIEYLDASVYNARHMSHEAVIPVPLSRPKVHRLPAAAPGAPPFFLSQAVWLRAGVMLAALVMVFVMLGRLVALSSSAHFSVTEALTPPPAAISAAEAAPVAAPGNPGTIVITGGAGTIVGQLARIPAQNEQITEVKPVTEVDKSAGPELLSIVSKY